MNMRIAIVAFAGTMALAIGAFAANPGTSEDRDVLPSGGLAISKATGKHICLLNVSQHLGKAELEKATLPIVLGIRSPIAVVDAKEQGPLEKKVAQAKKDPKVAFVIPFVDEKSDEMIRYHPGRELCIVNVNALTADGADHARVIERTKKLAWRAVGMMLGAGESVTGYTVLRRTQTLEQLDANPVTSPSPEQHNQMVDGLKAYGIDMVRVGTYRTACERGWAEPPTNDEQKAIWNEVHTPPSKPMKITYDKGAKKPVVK